MNCIYVWSTDTVCSSQSRHSVKWLTDDLEEMQRVVRQIKENLTYWNVKKNVIRNCNCLAYFPCKDNVLTASSFSVRACDCPPFGILFYPVDEFNYNKWYDQYTILALPCHRTSKFPAINNMDMCMRTTVVGATLRPVMWGLWYFVITSISKGIQWQFC